MRKADEIKLDSIELIDYGFQFLFCAETVKQAVFAGYIGGGCHVK